MGTLTTLSTILSLIPSIISAIKALEEAIPGQGKGEMKLAAVREIIEVSYDQASSILPTITKVITVLITTFNKTGTFK